MVTLSVLYTNDVHGAVEHFARAVYRIKQTKAELEAAGHLVLVVDGGDLEERSVPESHATKGAIMFKLLQAMGCQATAVGNSVPFCYGPERVKDQAVYGIPMVCANLLKDGQLVEGVVPTLILTFGDLKVGFTGVTHQMWGMYEQLFGFDCPDPFDVLPQHVAQLKTDGCQVIGVLAHLGMEVQNDFHRYPSAVDFVIDGHSHDVLEQPLNVNGIPICQAGVGGSHWGRLDLQLDEQYRVKSWWGNVYPVEEHDPQDTAILDTWKTIQAELVPYLDSPIAFLPDDLPLAYDCPSPMGQTLAKAVHEHVQPELTLVVTGHLHRGLQGGTVTRRDLYRVAPSPFMAAEGRLSGEEIMRILMRGVEHHAMRTRFFRGVPTGIFQTEGLTYQIEGSQVVNVRVGNAPLEMNRIYHVGTSYFLYEAGHRYYAYDIETTRFKLVGRALMHEVLEWYLTRHSPVR